MKNNSINDRSHTMNSRSIGMSALVFSFSFLIISFFLFVLSGHINDEDWTFVFAFAVGGIFPAGIVCYVSEFLIKKILLQKKKVSNFFAGFLGFSVGVALVLSVDFILWEINSNSSPFINQISFLEILIPSNLNRLLDFIFPNPFIIPGIFSIIFSTYVGWATNKAIILDPHLPAKE